MKKALAILLCFTMLIGSLCACGNAHKSDDGKLKIVVTIFPEYDWLRVLMGEHFRDAEVHMLLDSGTDLHNYQPTAQDMALITDCDLFVYIGGESDEWVEETLSAVGGNQKILCMMDIISGLAEEFSEGMQAEEDVEDEGAKDEHIWLSLKNAQELVKALCGALCEVDSESCETYRANCKSYCQSLAELDEAYSEMCAQAAYFTILVADRFPFRYLTEDYGLDYYAAFPGCAAASDISFETVGFLAQKLKDLALPAVIIIDGSDSKVAQTIIESAGTNAKVLMLDSCQCVSSKEIEDGANYLDKMISNLEILREALN